MDASARVVALFHTLLRYVDAIRAILVRGLASIRVRPNHLTILGALIAVSSGYLASQGHLLAAGLVFLAGSLMDGLDGALARHTNTSSSFGAYLDSVLDRVGESAILIGLIAHFAQEPDEIGVIVAAGALAASLLVSYTRARAEGLGLSSGGFIPAPRPIRVIILALGLVIGQPLPAVALVAVLAGISALLRLLAVRRDANPRD